MGKRLLNRWLKQPLLDVTQVRSLSNKRFTAPVLFLLNDSAMEAARPFWCQTHLQ
jgi:DNA mismatch repair ATPase MutS